MRTLTLAALVLLAACVHGDPVTPESLCEQARAMFVSDSIPATDSTAFRVTITCTD